MIIYILVATGSMKSFSGQHTILCKRAFLTEKSAEAYKPTFEVTAGEDRGGLFDVFPSTIKVSVGELELEDE